MPSWCACLVSNLVIRTRSQFYIKRDLSLNNDDDDNNDKDVRINKYYMSVNNTTFILYTMQKN